MLVDFHSVYERYAQDIFRFALYLSGDASLADDITQETFVRAWVTPGEVRGGTVRAYLPMIVRNLYRAERKREARQVALDESSLSRDQGRRSSPAPTGTGRCPAKRFSSCRRSTGRRC